MSDDDGKDVINLDTEDDHFRRISEDWVMVDGGECKKFVSVIVLSSLVNLRPRAKTTIISFIMLVLMTWWRIMTIDERKERLFHQLILGFL